MSEKKLISSKQGKMLAVLAAFTVMLVIVFGYNTFSGDKPGGTTVTEYRKQAPPPGWNDKAASKKDGRQDSRTASLVSFSADTSKAVLNVKGLSCSSCIQNIKDALAGIQGIEDILVDISRGSAQIYYNSRTLKEPDRIAQAVTAGGYPAALIKTYSSGDLRKEEAVAASKARYYIASVGGWDIARSDMDTQLDHAKRRYAKTYGENLFFTTQGIALVDNLRVQIVSRLIDEGIMMQEITKAGYKVDARAVDDELQKVVQQSGRGPEEFKTALAENAMTFEYFSKRVETQTLINRYLEENILRGASNDVEKQSLFTSWFNNAKILAEVSYYDKDLERLVQQLSARGGCGG
jgi:copper chaperone CopZ